MKVGLKLVFVTLPLFLIGVGFVAMTIATKPAPAQEEIAERITPVRVIRAISSSVSPSVTGFGLVSPARTHQAIAQVAGTAEYVNPLLNRGDILPQGAVLVRLSTSDYELAIAQARANIRASEARLAEIEVSEANLRATLAIEDEAMSLKTAELQRLEQLFTAGTASQSSLDLTRAAFLGQRLKVQSLENSIALLPTQHQVQIEQMAVYEATLQTAELSLARTELRLPFSARVGAVSVEIGQLVRSGEIIAEFDGIEAAEVEAQIAASNLQKMFTQMDAQSPVSTMDPSAMSEIVERLGITASVHLRLGDGFIEWPATLDRISNTIDPRAGTFGVFVRVEGAYGSAEIGRRPPLTKGMFVEVRLEASPIDGYVVPRSALRGDQLMIADADNRLQLLPVTVTLIQDQIVLITEGLDENTRVVVSAPVPMMVGMLLDPQQDIDLQRQLADNGSAE